MGDEKTRRVVRDAMRQSRVTEHKVVLQDFIQTSGGYALAEQVARVQRADVKGLVARISSLPRVDFYIPSRHHRLTWKGTADVAVVANMTASPPLRAFTIDGRSARIDTAGLVPTHFALFLLELEERKSPRVKPQRDRPGLQYRTPKTVRSVVALCNSMLEGVSPSATFRFW